jgi:hypothetical protein
MKVVTAFGIKSIDNLAIKYRNAIDSISDERNSGDGYWIYLKEPFFNTHLECATIHEHNLNDCIEQLKICVNKPITKEQYFNSFKKIK